MLLPGFASAEALSIDPESVGSFLTEAGLLPFGFYSLAVGPMPMNSIVAPSGPVPS
jgi:hypothetical protein